MDRPRPTRAEPLWLPGARLRRRTLPPRLVDWLLDPGSLTRRLQGRCAGRFSVRPLRQSWERPTPGEACRLGMARGGRALIREVELCCDGRVQVFARTVIPVTTLRGRRRRLARLGSRPLGAFLFAHRSLERGAMEVAALDAGQPLHRRAAGGRDPAPARIWGRRSVFRLDGRPLLVCEFFLPEPDGVVPPSEGP